MEIKYFDKPGYIAWSNSKNHSELIASASIYEEEGLYALNILELDLQERAKKINVIGSGYTNTPFRCVAWDTFGEKQNNYPHGLIFTGMDDGSFRLWNPNQMVATYNPQQTMTVQGLEGQTYLIYEQQPDDGAYPIMCGEWNSLKNNFLAFGGTELLLLDVSKDPSDPTLVKPGKKNPHQKSYVTSVSWNRQVPHILASASENGLVALWDIKSNNCIFNFKDSGVSSGNRNVVICWSKAISTQIAVTLDDQKRNQLQIWDLRNQKGPIGVIDRVHTKGINAMDWCQTDPELILSASRDNRLACWNYRQEDTPLSQATTDSNIFEVKWSKKLPSIYAVGGEQKISIHSLSDNLSGYVPKWYKVSAGATLLGSEASLSYSQQRGHVLHESKIGQHFKNPSVKAGLKSISNILSGVFDETQNQSQLSSLLKAKTSAQGDSGIYEYLGLSKQKIVAEVQKYTGKKRQYEVGHKSSKQKNAKPKAKAYTQLQGEDAFAFFEQIGCKKTKPNKQEEQDDNQGQIKYDMIPRNFNWDIGKERLVKQNILIGNYEGAIDAALKCGRTAEALIIAYSVDQNLFSNTLKTYFTETTDNFITDILKNIAYRDPVQLVNKHDLSKWKQCIALIYSMTSRDKRAHLLSLLAKRLIQETDESKYQKEQQVIPEVYPPIICYILAEDFNKIASIYSINLKLFKSGTLKRKEAVLEYTRRLLAIYQSLTIDVSSPDYHKLLRQSTFVAIEQGEKVIAHSICTRIPNNTKLLDYLVSTTKELQKYKTSISYKVISLPVMQPRKTEKKVVKGEQPANNKGKKQPIFPPKQQESSKNPPPPPSVAKKRVQQQSVGGFSPYQNAPKSVPQKGNAQLAVKKNLNSPPPPPVITKKALVQQIQQPQQERQSIQSKSTIQPPPKKNPPPPPSNYQQHIEQETKPTVKLPPQKQPPPPPPPQTEKKIHTQNAQQPQQKNSPPPPLPTQYKHESQVQKLQKPQPQIPIKKKNPPPPPVSKHIPQPDNIPTRQQHVPPPSKKVGPPPPSRVEQVKPKPQMNNFTQQPKYQEKKQIQYTEQPVRKQPPPPPVQAKRAPPPPPRRN